MSHDDNGDPGSKIEFRNRGGRWAILITERGDYKRRDRNPLAYDDGVTPLTFATEEDAYAASRDSKYRPYFQRESYRISPVYPPYPPLWSETAKAHARSRTVNDDTPPDLLAVYHNLVPLIQERFAAVPADVSPLLFAVLDSRAQQERVTLAHVPTEHARVLSARTLLDFVDALLDPAGQVETVVQLGWDPDFRPNIAVLVRQVWRTRDYIDGYLCPRLLEVPSPGSLHVLQVELRTHGGGALEIEWPVLHGEDGKQAVPMVPRQSTGSEELTRPEPVTIMEVPLKPPTVLDWYVGYLSSWLPRLGCPRWSDVRVTETLRYGPDNLPCEVGQVFTVEDYRARFTELCTRGWPWINLHAAGLLGGALLLSIELPAREPNGCASTSVNMSGARNAVARRHYILDGLPSTVGKVRTDG